MVFVGLWFSCISGSRGSRGSRGSLVPVVLVVFLVLNFPNFGGALRDIPKKRLRRRLGRNGPRFQFSFRQKRNMAIVGLFIVLILFSLSGCKAVNIDRATQAFIQAMLQRENICTLTGPIRAVPRGDYLRTKLGDSCEAFLVPDILFWDPTFYFPGVTLLCPSCEDQGLFEEVHPIRWKDGSRTYDQPRHLYGLRNDVLLVSRVYLCRNKHQILSHDPGIITQIKAEFLPPIVLCNKVGVTREMFQFVTSHVRAGMTISDIQVLWQQTLFDEYGLRKLCYVQETKRKAVDFPVFFTTRPKGW